MLLSLTFGAPAPDVPAPDVGYLLHKHPDRVHARSLAYGTSHVVFATATEACCELALVVSLDPVALVRGRPGSSAAGSGPMGQYVNDRPYVASSLLCVALAEHFRTALSGRCTARPELVEQAWPVEVHLPAVPARGGVGLLRRLFEPLGYAVEVEPLPCDETVPAWGPSSLVSLTLRHRVTVRDLLQHLYVLVPVLDDDKHYWVGPAEVDKLLRRGASWLPDHPERDTIALRYLKRRRPLARRALARLVPEDDDEADPPPVSGATSGARPPSLQKQRITWVVEQLVASGARTLADVGCGEGQLLGALLFDRRFTRLVGVDPSPTALDRCERRLKLDERAPAVRDRVTLLQGALGWRDRRLDGLDAVALVEVIEHIDADRLGQVTAALFGASRPQRVIVTTPNVEANALYDLAPGQRRHRDHRFEWDRATFAAWAHEVATTYGYAVSLHGIGPEHERLGAPTQAAVFTVEVSP